jgi:phage/plasmid-like protein (TIGR03299 family)
MAEVKNFLNHSTKLKHNSFKERKNMSANLLIENGRASMFYIDEVPWHNMGAKLDEPATAREAIQAANLDWRVVKVPLFAGSKRIPVPDKFATVRKTSSIISKSDPVLGVVGKDYTPLQNTDAFNFFDPIVGENAAIYHTAGALGKGERIWILAKLPDYIRVVGDDIAEKYLLLSNSHDGKSSVQIKFTPVRVVCQNTLTQALNDGNGSWRIVHHSDIHQKIKQAHEMLGLIKGKFNALEASFQRMARVKMDRNRLHQYLVQVYPAPKEEEQIALVQRDRDWSEYFFDQGRGNRLPDVSGSLWAAFNGVTEWLDHRKGRQNEGQRLNSLWFGEGARIKNRAYEVAVNWN